MKDDGFSLVSVMIASAMVGAISLGIANIMKNARKSYGHIATNVSIDNKVAEIERMLSNTQACKGTFSSYYESQNTLDLASVSEIKDKFGRVILREGDRDSSGVLCKSISSSLNSNGELILEIEFERNNKQSYGGKTIKKEIIITPKWVDTTNDTIYLVETLNLDGETIYRPPLYSELTTDHDFFGCEANARDIASTTDADPESVCASIEGGTWDPATEKCQMGDSAAESFCNSIDGAVWDTDNEKCLLGQEFVCLQEKSELSKSESGGMTTQCSPNEFIAGTHLTGGKTKQQCLDSGGGVVISGSEVVCKFSNTETCPAGWANSGHYNYFIRTKSFDGLSWRADLLALIPDYSSLKTGFTKYTVGYTSMPRSQCTIMTECSACSWSTMYGYKYASDKGLCIAYPQSSQINVCEKDGLIEMQKSSSGCSHSTYKRLANYSVSDRYSLQVFEVGCI